MSFPIYVWDLTPDTTLESVLSFFDYCGHIESSKEHVVVKAGVSTRVIQLNFDSEGAVQLARLLHNAPLNDSKLSVSESMV
jgi:RNA recognition motif-containing protein